MKTLEIFDTTFDDQAWRWLEFFPDGKKLLRIRPSSFDVYEIFTKEILYQHDFKGSEYSKGEILGNNIFVVERED